MAVRGRKRSENGYEKAQSGTIYWTLSLYIEPDKVASALGYGEGEHVPAALFRRAQMQHNPSFALRNAVDPLLNDIADRESRGEVQEFLLAATAANPEDLDEAASTIRDLEELVFEMPESLSWATEGVRFHAHPPSLNDERLVRLRRFWMSHNNGALSYHLSFSHYYGGYVDEHGAPRSGYDPATYYFLSSLQKLAAPKEYSLDTKILAELINAPDPYVSVFDRGDLGIDPLDKIKVRGADQESASFWPFVRTRFEADAVQLFDRLNRARASQAGVAEDVAAFRLAQGFEKSLLDLVPFIEVPGLKVPKSRFMFMLHDERFFDRLMPLDEETRESVARKQMVRQDCYDPYQRKMDAVTAPIGGRPPKAVHLGRPPRGVASGERAAPDYWRWVMGRPEYLRLLAVGALERTVVAAGQEQASSDDGSSSTPIAAGDLQGLQEAVRTGACRQVKDWAGRPLAQPRVHHAPSFEVGRADCLDYLFLAGFNQNIIDFMNQDTSEILDSIDPIYPGRDEQSEERFFVRYANHRAMITYVPMSRSLEIGNDYIGACPYAFLIHALALHNEFLGRAREEASLDQIEDIKRLIDAGDFDEAARKINAVKLAEFDRYERFRYANPFRYDTERDVFAKLEELRGVSRKGKALALAVESLEDHASDLQRLQQQVLDKEAAGRDMRLNVLLGGMGVFGAGQMLYWIGEKAAGDKDAPPRALVNGLAQASPGTGEAILSGVEAVMILATVVFLAYLLWIIGLGQLVGWIRRVVSGRQGWWKTPLTPTGRE